MYESIIELLIILISRLLSKWSLSLLNIFTNYEVVCEISFEWVCYFIIMSIIVEGRKKLDSTQETETTISAINSIHSFITRWWARENYPPEKKQNCMA